ncbi:hypothetical protein [Streptomyces pluripotens]|nr:hypothetical protein [Streptomyces pluripotens]
MPADATGRHVEADGAPRGADGAQPEVRGDLADTAGGPAETPGRARGRGGSRRRTAGVVGTVLLAVAVVAGAGCTAVTVLHADRDPGKPVWKFPKVGGSDGTDDEVRSGSTDGVSALRAMLVPYQKSGYSQGPDIAGFGSDAQLTGREATALRKQSIRDLPPQARRKLDDLIDHQHIKGMVMRSYEHEGSISSPFDKPFTIGFQLVEMENRGAAEKLATAGAGLLKSFGEGPEIPGHENAVCVLEPTRDSGKLDRMLCSARVGDVLFSARVCGVHRLAAHTVALFVGEQLDRIKDPGKAV